jgi:hypothetical protein
MLLASWRIRKQLAHTPGCLRFANIVMSHREVWTLTVWRTRQEMLDFMGSGAHEDIMWDFSKWLESFWLMRWRPSADETGAWDGLQLAGRPALPTPPPERTAEQKAALAAALDSIPRLRAASAPSGAASLEYAPSQRRWRGMVAGAVGATIRVEVPHLLEAPQARRDVARLRRSLLTDDLAVRCAFGLSEPRACYLLALFRDEKAWNLFIGSQPIVDLRRRWPEGVWTMRWDADNEFGHWDGLRLRKVKRGTKVEVPQAAKRAVEVDGPPEG